MKKHIPNTLTCCNLLSGCLATYFALQANYLLALLLIILGAVFDFFDGFAARLLHVSSPMGKELDSLADDITFGFAPAAIVYAMLGQLFVPQTYPDCPQIGTVSLLALVPYVAFLISAFSALRLAKFNIDDRQSDKFIGLPTPANALFWAALAYTMHHHGLLRDDAAVGVVIVAAALLSCWLLVCEVPMFALKFKHFGWSGNQLRYCFVGSSVILLAGLGIVGICAVIVLYVLLSITSNLIGTKVVRVE